MMATMAENATFKEMLDRGVTVEDVKLVLSKFWGKLHGVLGKVPFARQATALFYLSRDGKVPLGVKGTAVLALLYFISPIDAVPDALPLIGLMDDAAVIATALTVLGPLMKPYLQKADDWYAKGQKIEPEQEVVKHIEITQ